jgi:feruloyl esterase
MAAPALLPLLASLSAMAGGPAPETCSALAGRVRQVEVVRAQPFAAGAFRPEGGGKTSGSYAPLPVSAGLCRVQGRIEGSIGFELWLPQEWNGRLLGAGVGGDAGVFNYRDMSLRVGQGFAVVTTDSGHKASDPHWMRGAKARADYEHRAVHLATQAAKALVQRYYAKPVDHAYFMGCSGGGRQALKEMQLYPADYDGVVAGAPGPYMPLQSVRMLWFALEQQRQPAAMLSDADWALYERRTFDACDKRDGVSDGVVENPLTCHAPTADLLCKAGQLQDCLTAPKLAMLDLIIAPLRDEHGRAMDKGLLAGVRTRPGPPSPLLNAMWADALHDNPDWDARQFARSADLAAINVKMPQLRADSTAITPFLKRGGKAILYQGWQDPSTNAGPTIDYYAALARAHGGVTRLGRSVRLFMVPGMYHCRGGPGADSFGGSGHLPASGEAQSDILWSLIEWVEKARVPAQIIATRREGEAVAFTRKLCPYPARAAYDGRGNSRLAASYRCVTDGAMARRLR